MIWFLVAAGHGGLVAASLHRPPLPHVVSSVCVRLRVLSLYEDHSVSFRAVQRSRTAGCVYMCMYVPLTCVGVHVRE